MALYEDSFELLLWLYRRTGLSRCCCDIVGGTVCIVVVVVVVSLLLLS